MGKVWKGIGTTTFIATRAAMIAGAGLVIIGTIAAIKDRFTGEDEEPVAVEVIEIDIIEAEEN